MVSIYTTDQDAIFCRNTFQHPGLIYVRGFKNTSPGADGVTAEHLFYGKCDTLCNVIADLFSTLLAYSIVPDVFTLGIIVPFL